ncbi:MAG: hypothetical protein HKO55_07845 [Gammaproteobacteria bacterium]|nr:hypothetical protein [Gammaproteobacteria bacterium]
MTEQSSGDTSPGRWQLIRDAAVFQVKLFADGMRDLILSPLSFFLTLADLVTGGNRFYNLLSLGRRTDVWINLFGNYGGGSGIDEAVDRIEALIAEQYRKGGITASARQAVDSALDRVVQESRPPAD